MSLKGVNMQPHF